jgi:hypothetical protein
MARERGGELGLDLLRPGHPGHQDGRAAHQLGRVDGEQPVAQEGEGRLGEELAGERVHQLARLELEVGLHQPVVLADSQAQVFEDLDGHQLFISARAMTWLHLARALTDLAQLGAAVAPDGNSGVASRRESAPLVAGAHAASGEQLRHRSLAVRLAGVGQAGRPVRSSRAAPHPSVGEQSEWPDSDRLPRPIF